MDFIAVAYTIWAILMFALVVLVGPFVIGKDKPQGKFTAGWYIIAVIQTGLTAFLLWHAYL